MHEKSILLPLLPASALALREPRLLRLFAPLACFSMWPLLRRDRLAGAYCGCLLLYCALTLAGGDTAAGGGGGADGAGAPGAAATGRRRAGAGAGGAARGGEGAGRDGGGGPVRALWGSFRGGGLAFIAAEWGAWGGAVLLHAVRFPHGKYRVRCSSRIAPCSASVLRRHSCFSPAFCTSIG